jgi:tetraacyldisaccharide 4'-kinase
MLTESDTPQAGPAEPAGLTGLAGAQDWWRRIALGAEQPRGWGVPLAGVLVLLSLLYGIAAALILWMRALRPARAPVPVISVGNLVAGGAGKTPTTIFLARRLKNEGRKVAIVSRGYGRRSRGEIVVSRGDAPAVKWHEAGDEPYLMAILTSGVAIVAAERRAAGVRLAVEKLGADTILLDDAFQHVQLARDLDIVVVDAAAPVGNGHLLPGGPLREHPSGIGRCDLIVATRCDRADGARAVEGALGPLASHAPIIESRMKPVELWDVGSGDAVKLSGLRKGKVLALSSIADPSDFESMLAGLGLDLAARIALPDHHDYTEEDTAVVLSAAREVGADAIVTTEKDAVRLRPWRSRLPLVALGIELEVTAGGQHLDAALRRALERPGKRRPGIDARRR